jgi:hypothetical protein
VEAGCCSKVSITELFCQAYVPTAVLRADVLQSRSGQCLALGIVFPSASPQPRPHAERRLGRQGADDDRNIFNGDADLPSAATILIHLANLPFN